jgi:hypothetical protein
MPSKRRERSEVGAKKVRTIFGDAAASGNRTVRKVGPVADPSNVTVSLTNPDAVLTPAKRRDRDKALDTLAQHRRDAEARAGSVRLA